MSLRSTLLRLATFAVVLLAAGCGPSADREASVGREATVVHPRFDLTMEDLRILLRDVPGDVRIAALRRPEYFLELIACVLALPEERLILVDKDHGLPMDYEPADLVRAADFPVVVNRADLMLREVVMPDLLAMSTAARLEGLTLDLSSGYRSYEYQAGLFERHVASLGLEQARRESAEPGHSQHQLGTTIDFGSITPAFAATPAGRWLAENAWKFGFSLSYPEGLEELTGYMYESWHFRYLGREATRLEREFFGGVQQHMLVFLSSHRDDLESRLT